MIAIGAARERLNCLAAATTSEWLLARQEDHMSRLAAQPPQQLEEELVLPQSSVPRRVVEIIITTPSRDVRGTAQKIFEGVRRPTAPRRLCNECPQDSLLVIFSNLCDVADDGIEALSCELMANFAILRCWRVPLREIPDKAYRKIELEHERRSL